ncbi:GAF domain-containing SpoIIE family protein phosphatase [Paraoerskovia marina]|uniref:GAF domain-containing SpoIIE family protein phosphatase n=1 Tax=Paraoerskovia marina TaxID=545619 RepID=UPI0004926B0C|nr:GAF domain-containing SpoIIE family protein phosphatase [Paraoerskovia marina]
MPEDSAVAATASDETFERYARLAQAYLGAPATLVSFLDDTGVRMPGATGLSGPVDEHRRIDRTHSYCPHVVASDAPLVIEDAREHEYFRTQPVVTELDVVAYAGYPLHDVDGRTVGALCAFDRDPREWTPNDLSVLADLAASCTAEIRLRGEALRVQAERDRAERSALISSLMREVGEAFLDALLVDEVVDAVARCATSILGVVHTSVALLADDRQSLYWPVHEPIAGVPAELWEFMDLEDDRYPAVRAVRDRSQVFLEDGPTVVERFPLLAEFGAGAEGLWILPFVTPGAVYGALALRWSDAVPIALDLKEVTVALAGNAALALERAYLLEHRREVASVLQAAMLTDLPTPTGLAVDAAYAPASVTEEVGGDWYDVLERTDGSVALVVGDVTGHDINAASQMGQVRSTLRTLLWEHDDAPSRVLERLDDVVVGTGMAAVATIVLAIVSPTAPDGSRELTWSLAGHPPPLLRTAAGEARFLAATPGLPVGIETTRERPDGAAHLEAGDRLVLYTDGLVETRTVPLWDRLEALRSSVGDQDPASADELLDRMVRAEDRGDDVVVLTVSVGSPQP